MVVAHRPVGLVALGEVGLPWYSLEGHPDAATLAARGRERLALWLWGMAVKDIAPAASRAR